MKTKLKFSKRTEIIGYYKYDLETINVLNSTIGYYLPMFSSETRIRLIETIKLMANIESSEFYLIPIINGELQMGSFFTHQHITSSENPVLFYFLNWIYPYIEKETPKIERIEKYINKWRKQHEF